jgi:hypothetical protein
MDKESIVMECQVCGRNNQGNANFCENCGNSLRTDNYENQGGDYYQQPYYSQEMNNQGVNPTEEKETPISFKSWLGTLLLPLIPFVGGLIYIVMLFVWAFDNNTPQSKKNWARASLLVSLIGFVLVMIFFAFIVAAIINGAFSMYDMEQFYY